MDNPNKRPDTTVDGNPVINNDVLSTVPYVSNNNTMTIVLSLKEKGNIVQLSPSDDSNVDTDSVFVTVDDNTVQVC